MNDSAVVPLHRADPAHAPSVVEVRSAGVHPVRDRHEDHAQQGGFAYHAPHQHAHAHHAHAHDGYAHAARPAPAGTRRAFAAEPGFSLLQQSALSRVGLVMVVLVPLWLLAMWAY